MCERRNHFGFVRDSLLHQLTYRMGFNNAHAYLLRKSNNTALNADLCSGL